MSQSRDLSQHVIILDHTLFLQFHQTTPLGKSCCQATVSGGRLPAWQPTSCGVHRGGVNQWVPEDSSWVGTPIIHPNYSCPQGFLLCYFDPIPQTQTPRVWVTSKIAGISGPKTMGGKVTKIKPFLSSSCVHCHIQLHPVSPVVIPSCVQPLPHIQKSTILCGPIVFSVLWYCLSQSLFLIFSYCLQD